ncbi:MAG TPA: type II toxin-antitoxin system HipA family toxin, partial [Acidisoma sp.]|nr:type II toxin-antitoxin system HipA family toxin [Acidisoma sp.]
RYLSAACTGGEANQGMSINGDDRRSRLETCRSAAARFLLSDAKARSIIDGQIAKIRDGWDAVCKEAGMSAMDRAFLWKRQFLNAYTLESYRST